MSGDQIQPMLGRCGECGGLIEPKFGPGRTREYLRGIWLTIPEDFSTPACAKCGAEYMAPEVSERLDEVLRRQLTTHVDQCVKYIQTLNGVTQQDIEDAIGVTRTYLSHLRAGRKEPSAPLIKLLELCAFIPDCFQHVREKRPVTLAWPAALIVVGKAGRAQTGSGFRATRRYSSSYEDPPAQQASERLSA